MANPGYSNAGPERSNLNSRTDGVDNHYNFVPRNDWKLEIWQITIDNVQIGATDPASFHAHSDLARPGC
jgi:hypothetical protein